MKYKGIELNEFKSEKPVIFDPPKRMLVWDGDDETPTEEDVIAFHPNQYNKVIKRTSSSIHCAEIPEILCRRATNRELAKWLALGNGQIQFRGSIPIWIQFFYDIGHDDYPCSKYITARKWGDKEWHEPTLEYLGLEDK